MTDFTKWVAMPNEYSDGDSESWFIAPEEFWNKNNFIPDDCIGFTIPGFFECSEHTIESTDPSLSVLQQAQALKDLGFKIIDFDFEEDLVDKTDWSQDDLKKAAELFRAQAEWFATNDYEITVPKWCELFSPWESDKGRVLKLYKKMKDSI